jgi:hypothetical protein
MPSNATLRRQRALGGALGIIVLGCADVSLFPAVFHVDPTQAPRSIDVDGEAGAGQGYRATDIPAIAEVNAGPPLTLAPRQCDRARTAKEADLPEQLSADTPAVQDLLTRGAKALQAGQLAGDKNSAAALFAQALKAKPDSRRAAQGLFDVRARLVAEIDQDIAVGDADRPGSARCAAHAAQCGRGCRTGSQPENPGQGAADAGQGAALLAQGKADQPVDGSALDMYRRCRSSIRKTRWPSRASCRCSARCSIARWPGGAEQFRRCGQGAAEAQAIRPGSQQMQDVRKRVDDMREQRASGVLAQAHSALDGGNLALAASWRRRRGQIDPESERAGRVREAADQCAALRQLQTRPGVQRSLCRSAGQDAGDGGDPHRQFPDGRAGQSRMDSARTELPQHAVTIDKGFAMARSAITVDSSASLCVPAATCPIR